MVLLCPLVFYIFTGQNSRWVTDFVYPQAYSAGNVAIAYHDFFYSAILDLIYNILGPFAIHYKFGLG